MIMLYDIQKDALVSDNFIELGITESTSTKVALSPSNTITVTNQLIENTSYTKRISISLTANLTARCFSETVSESLFDPVVIDWANRVVINGGNPPSSSTKSALTTFYRGLVFDGLDTLMIALNCFVPDSLSASITPLIVGPGNDPWTNSGTSGFVDADLSVNGLLGNVSTNTKYLDTGCNPTTIYSSDNDCGFTIYFAANSVNLAYGAMIVRRGNIAGIYTDPNSHLGAYQGWSVTGNPIQSGNLNFRFLSGNRTAVNSASLYEASSSYFVVGGSTSGAPGTRPNGNLYCYCWDDYDGVPSGDHSGLFGVTRNYYSFAAIHHGLTQTQANNLYNRVQTLRQTLGGGYS